MSKKSEIIGHDRHYGSTIDNVPTTGEVYDVPCTGLVSASVVSSVRHLASSSGAYRRVSEAKYGACLLRRIRPVVGR